MSRFEKMAEEKRRQLKERKISIHAKRHQEILVETHSESDMVLKE
ncbi:MAG: hypothetical protein PVF96_04975 [Candidatus Bathyarchaeota archaeon]